MPALPWTAGPYRPDNHRTMHVLASTLPLRRFRDIPRFLRWTREIRAQLRTAEGCAGYHLDARLLRKTFHTHSAWSDAEAMNAFVHSGRHAAMLADMAGRLGQPTFVEYNSPARTLPLDWATARQQLRNQPRSHD